MTTTTPIDFETPQGFGGPAEAEGSPPSLPPAAPPIPPARDPRPRRGRIVAAGAALALALAAGASGAALTRAVDGGSTTTVAASATAGAPSSSRIAGPALSVGGIVAKVGPSVVAVNVNYRGGGSFATGGPSGGAGTGIILTSDGEVLTNAHVVADATTVHVTLSGEAKARAATVIGFDAGADLALLRITGTSGLAAAQLGSSSGVHVGDDVVAIGNALALQGGPTVTKGIVSALDRSVDGESGVMTGLIQTDASISSGNSGGPLVNASGQVIGINSAVATGGRTSSAENIGFAIAMDKARPVIDRISTGKAAGAAAFLGVGTADAQDGSRGALVQSVTQGSPAADARLAPGDLVVSVDGHAVNGASDLTGLIQAHVPGDRVTLTVDRGDQVLSLTVTLASRPGN